MNPTPFRKLVFGALWLLSLPAHATPGDLDSLNANVVGGSIQASVQATAVQPDGKIIVAGRFTSVLGVPRNNIARFNANGTLDMAFDPNPSGIGGDNDFVESVAVQADGKVLLGGAFTRLQPNGAAAATERSCIARVNASGTLDTGFDPKVGGILLVDCVAVQPDGKVLISGQFTTLQPNGAPTATARQRIARVNADGTLDIGFDPKADGIVYCMAVQADGKVLLGGNFTTLQPNGAPTATARQHIARVNADGTLDPTFDLRTDYAVYCVTAQADGKVLLGGDFFTLQPGGGSFFTRWGIARMNADGTLDTGFNPNPNHSVYSIVVQADGKVLIAGGLYTIRPNGVGPEIERHGIARVNADGTLDTGFDPDANAGVMSVALQPDGKVLIGGFYTTLQPNGAASPTTRNRFARLQNDPASQTLSVPDPTQVLWQRNSAAPELTRVTFELSTNGGASWSPLGTGTRIGITANWQITNLSLPDSGSLRARSAPTGGLYNGSSGLLEQSVNFGDGHPFQAWKLALVGDAAAPNDGDTDFDGLRTILEYATGGDPQARGALPAASSIAGTTAITFTHNTAASDVTLTVQGSDDLATWTDLARGTGSAAMVALAGGVMVTEFGAGTLRTVEVRDLYAIGDPAHPRRYLRLQAAP